jgi:hypothetical protein
MSDARIPLFLTVKGLQGIEKVNHERDFSFVVGDERYPCPSFVAEFLSPRVISLRSEDITLDEFSIETEDPNHQFGRFLSIGLGNDVSFSDDEMPFVRSVCGELWNFELFQKTLKQAEEPIAKEEVKARLDFLCGVDGGCECEIGIVASHFYELSVSDFDQMSRSVFEAILNDSRLVVWNEDSVFEIIHSLASKDLSYFGLLEFVHFEFLSVGCMARASEFISSSLELLTFGMWSRLHARLALSVTPPLLSGRFLLPLIDSKIVSTTPRIFSVFADKQLRLLYRGSRDGLQASAFHHRCNGHRNTVSLILTTNKCIFGGYTPLAWTSTDGYVSDPSLTSFVFTIKNPHNLPERIFKQKQEASAIHNGSAYGPTFGSNLDFRVYEPFQTAKNNYSHLGGTYINDTGIAGNQMLTGESNFAVDEMEIFEVV